MNDKLSHDPSSAPNPRDPYRLRPNQSERGQAFRNLVQGTPRPRPPENTGSEPQSGVPGTSPGSSQ